VFELTPTGFTILSRLAAGLGLSIFFLYPFAGLAKSPDRIYEEVSKSVVVVGGLDTSGVISQGSGVVVSKDHIITNCHVVANVRDVRVIQNQLSFRAQLLRRHIFADLCLLNVSSLPFPPITRFISIKALKVGQRAYSIGSPFGLELTLSEGLVSGLRTTGDLNFVQTSAIFSNGSSGGGLFDEDGALIGITTSKIKGEAGIGFALPADFVRDVLSGTDVKEESKDKYESLAAEARAGLQASIADQAAPRHGFTNSVAAVNWLAEMTPRLEMEIPTFKSRVEFLRTVHYEATRAGLDPQLVLALIDDASGFRKFAVASSGAQGYMQVHPYWIRLMGRSGDNLLSLRTNLRYGCVIFKSYLDEEKGDLFRALKRYDASRIGRSKSASDPDFPNRVIELWRSKWRYQGRLT
jgi:hypothetical protein